MTQDDIRALRKQLKCTMQELAATLGVDARTVVAWEDAEMFPTKQFIERMRKLGERGPDAVVRKGRRRTAPPTAMEALGDPELWRLLRKLIAHPELRKRVAEIADDYDDPAG